MKTKRLLALAAVLAAAAGSTMAFGGWPEAITPTNSLPPTAGQYELWPPASTVRWAFTLTFGETNFPCQFDLERITAGSFTNIVRTAFGDDQVLDFEAIMTTRVPYMRLGDEEHQNMALSDQLGHLRVRVKEGAIRSMGRFDLGVEEFSWTLRGHDDQNNWYDLIHVRLQDAVPSPGWINITNHSQGSYVMQSELTLQVEGALVILATNYFTPVTGPVRLALRGQARTLQTLAMAPVVDDGESRVVLDNSHLGPAYRYAIEYSTNLTDWQDYTWTNVFGDVERWLAPKEIVTWRDVTPPAPAKLFRLKANQFP